MSRLLLTLLSLLLLLQVVEATSFAILLLSLRYGQQANSHVVCHRDYRGLRVCRRQRQDNSLLLPLLLLANSGSFKERKREKSGKLTNAEMQRRLKPRRDSSSCEKE